MHYILDTIYEFHDFPENSHSDNEFFRKTITIKFLTVNSDIRLAISGKSGKSNKM